MAGHVQNNSKCEVVQERKVLIDMRILENNTIIFMYFDLYRGEYVYEYDVEDAN